MSRARALISSEALALLAIVCIAAIFLVASLNRELDRYDRQAKQVAQQIQYLMQGPAAGQAVTLERLRSLGLKVPSGVQMKIEIPQGGQWQISVWHNEGAKRYLVTAKGVSEQMR